jgi:hypothetical protein
MGGHYAVVFSQSQRQGKKVEKPSTDPLRSTSPDAVARKRLNQKAGEGSSDRLSIELENYLADTAPASRNGSAPGSPEYPTYADTRRLSISKVNFDEDQDDDEGAKWWCGLRQPKTILGIKVNTIVRMLKVCSAFPFVIVVAALNFSNKYAFLRYATLSALLLVRRKMQCTCAKLVLTYHCIFSCRSVTGIRVMNILIYVAPVVYGKIPP